MSREDVLDLPFLYCEKQKTAKHLFLSSKVQIYFAMRDSLKMSTTEFHHTSLASDI